MKVLANLEPTTLTLNIPFFVVVVIFETKAYFYTSKITNGQK